MDTVVIIDTSVALKWVAPEKEPHLEIASMLFQDIANHRVNALSLDFLLVELANVLHKARHFNEEKIFLALHTITTAQVFIVPVNISLIHKAIKLSKKYNQTVYDGLYLALAEQKQTRLITADKTLIKISQLTIPLWEYRKTR